MSNKLRILALRYSALLMFVSILFLANRESSDAQEIYIYVTNPAPFDRPIETVEVPWENIIRENVLINQEKCIVLDDEQTLVSQLIDKDGNGIPELLLFQSAFKNGERKRFILKYSEIKSEPQPLTDAKFILPRRDVAWENDRIAYRIYGGPLAGDVRNGIDVWVKRVRYFIIDNWYRGDSLRGRERISYHVDHGEGADFFTVGKSLGAGGCALWKDSMLHQPGLFMNQRIIATGPIRSMFTLWYKADSMDNLQFKEEATFILDANDNLNKIEVLYYDIPENREMSVAIGLVNRENTQHYADENSGWLSLWGLTNNDSTNGMLGTGIILPTSSFKEIKEHNGHYIMIGSTALDGKINYYAGAGWTRSGDFNSVDDWNKYLSKYAERLYFPLQVSLYSH